jgi:hypothetical protein
LLEQSLLEKVIFAKNNAILTKKCMQFGLKLQQFAKTILKVLIKKIENVFAKWYNFDLKIDP